MNQIEKALETNKVSGRSKADLLPSSVVDNLADEIGIRNPQWRDLYIALNGGHPEKDYYQYGDNNDFTVNNFLNLGNGDSDAESALKIKQSLFKEVEFFPIARDGGGNILLIRINSTDLSVYAWYNDTRSKPIPIASSILEFLTKLEEFPEEDFE
ncbi:SMI1/KNR4 family protein [Deinococcus depolymerans]|uniref:Knr4/Smi1-like domain-containing protein n=1 Tax=Deinococcus depolymerans TaxID=392408 RepID=A0ABN1BUF4_9DEIO